MLFKSTLFVFFHTLLSASSLPDVQKSVETRFPKNERLRSLKLGDVARHLRIQTGSVVADVGCGSGEIAVVLAAAIGRTGKVFCEDINWHKQFGLAAARATFKAQKIKNGVFVKGNADSPKLPAAALDAVLVSMAYHEFVNHEAMLKEVKKSLKPNGRLVILDMRPNRTASRPRDKQTKNHVIAPDIVAKELETAGFRISSRNDFFIDDPDSESVHWLIEAEPI